MVNTASAADLVRAANGSRAAVAAARRLDRLRPHDAAHLLLDAVRQLQANGERPEAGSPLREVVDALAQPTKATRRRATPALLRGASNRQEPEQ